MNVQSRFSEICLVVDVFLLSLLFVALIHGFDALYDYNVQQTVKALGVGPYVFPCLLFSLLLREPFLSSHELLFVTDSCTIAVLAVLMISDVDFGLSHSLTDYLAASFLVCCAPLSLLVVIVVQMSALAFALWRWEKPQEYEEDMVWTGGDLPQYRGEAPADATFTAYSAGSECAELAERHNSFLTDDELVTVDPSLRPSDGGREVEEVQVNSVGNGELGRNTENAAAEADEANWYEPLTVKDMVKSLEARQRRNEERENALAREKRTEGRESNTFAMRSERSPANVPTPLSIDSRKRRGGLPQPFAGVTSLPAVIVFQDVVSTPTSSSLRFGSSSSTSFAHQRNKQENQRRSGMDYRGKKNSIMLTKGSRKSAALLVSKRPRRRKATGGAEVYQLVGDEPNPATPGRTHMETERSGYGNNAPARVEQGIQTITERESAGVAKMFLSQTVMGGEKSGDGVVGDNVDVLSVISSISGRSATVGEIVNCSGFLSSPVVVADAETGKRQRSCERHYNENKSSCNSAFDALQDRARTCTSEARAAVIGGGRTGVGCVTGDDCAADVRLVAGARQATSGLLDVTDCESFVSDPPGQGTQARGSRPMVSLQNPMECRYAVLINVDSCVVSVRRLWRSSRGAIGADAVDYSSKTITALIDCLLLVLRRGEQKAVAFSLHGPYASRRQLRWLQRLSPAGFALTSAPAPLRISDDGLDREGHDQVSRLCLQLWTENRALYAAERKRSRGLQDPELAHDALTAMRVATQDMLRQLPALQQLTVLGTADHWPFRQLPRSGGVSAAKKSWDRFRAQHQQMSFHFVAVQ